MRRTIEKARTTELKPLLQIKFLIERELKSCWFANFTVDARVSPVFLPNKCACLDSKKYVSTIGFFLTN